MTLIWRVRLFFAYDVLNGPFFDALHANRNMNFYKAQLFGQQQDGAMFSNIQLKLVHS